MAMNNFLINKANWMAALYGSAKVCTLVDKRQASRRGRYSLVVRHSCFVVFYLSVAMVAPALTLSNSDAKQIGRKIWQNECNGTVAGLASWNEGEDFASLGIGHFIWYPKGVRGPFEESFPKLVSFISRHGAKRPALLLPPNDLSCPWRTRREFLAAQDTPAMKQLRRFLVDTIDLQAQFMVARLQESLPKMLREVAPSDRPKIERRFNKLGTTAQGCYALVDYVNFKGEGVLPTERYRGQGWGLLQVLEATQEASVTEFSRSAEAMLRQRVQNSPPQRKEARWLPGWLKRIHTYTRE
jgi:hypothetical protein